LGVVQWWWSAGCEWTIDNAISIERHNFPMHLTLSVPTNLKLRKKFRRAFAGSHAYRRSERMVRGRPVWEHVEGGRWLYFDPNQFWIFTKSKKKVGQGDPLIGTIRSAGACEGRSPLEVEQWQWWSAESGWTIDNAISTTIVHARIGPCPINPKEVQTRGDQIRALQGRASSVCGSAEGPSSPRSAVRRQKASSDPGRLESITEIDPSPSAVGFRSDPGPQ
jgi:hypothetical protein